jgi:iron complex outermembrane receptor protein
MASELRLNAIGVALLCLGGVVGVGNAAAESAASRPNDTLQLEQIVVTARRVEENLQSVPDAITVFSAAKLSDFGVKTIEDVSNLTPNLAFHSGDAFEPGTFNITMRGIGTASGGWPSVSYIVDGVPQTSTDSIQRGTLEDIERIEILRGPQSAMYGFNAIAGAINVITSRPTNDWRFRTDLIYGNGPNRQVGGTMSGAIVPDTLLLRFSADYRDDNGLLRSASNGVNLDFRDWKQVQGKLLFIPLENLTVTLSGNWDKEHDGATYEDKVPGPQFADDFSNAFNARRAYPGAQDRTLYTTAAHVQWDLNRFSLIATLGYDRIDAQNNSNVCYDDPNDPVVPLPGRGTQCLISPAFGNAAMPGEAIDEPFFETRQVKTLTSDVRVASRGPTPIDWTIGVSTLHRDYTDGDNIGDSVAPDRTYVLLYPNWNLGHDKWWGLYSQAIWHATSKLNLTVAARYDHETYENTQYTDQTLSTILPAYQNGAFVDTQRQTATAFQPKGQLDYHFTDDVMGYISVSRGFRAGFYSFGLYTLPEHTTNYELGVKSTFWDRRVLVNAAAFYIDYSNQQYYTNIAQPPYVATLTIPKTGIDGAELETTILASRFVTLGASLGYLNTQVADGGGWSPDTPRFNGNAYVDFTAPVGESWKARLHVDDRYNTRQYLGQGNTLPSPAKDFLNLRAGFFNERYDIALFVRNLTDRREQTQAGVEAAGGFLRFQNEPRSYGVEVKASF